MEKQNYGGLGEVFWKKKPLVGMVHLLPLPGSPQEHGGGIAAVLERAAADARALESGGVDAIIVENFFDSPFARQQVPPHTVAAMARAVQCVRENTAVPMGVNVLRNDACSGLAIAHICGAQFIRVNVYVGAAVTDQGIIQGAARDVVLYRRELGANVAIWADVFVKHASQLGSGRIEDAARDAALRGLADALVVSGASTGAAANLEDLRRVKAAVPHTPLLVGSGLDHANALDLLSVADGAIVGTSLKSDGIISNPVELERVQDLRRAFNAGVRRI